MLDINVSRNSEEAISWIVVSSVEYA